VFVTERDNLGGQFASEGVLGGDVMDPPVANPVVIEKPSYAAVATLAGCYASLGRDCPGPAPAAEAGSPTIPATRLGSSSFASVTVSDPGSSPVALGSAGLLGPDPDPFAVSYDSCSSQILEPDQTCTLVVKFTPMAGGAIRAALVMASDNGPMAVPLTAVAPSVSSLISPQLVDPVFTPTGAADGVGHTQQLALYLTNPLSTPVHVANARLSGPEARRFAISSDHCVNVVLAAAGGCRVSVLFTPTRAGIAHVLLGLRGDGAPLSVALSATAFALPDVALVRSANHRPCFARSSRSGVVVLADQPTTVSWSMLRVHRGVDGDCRARTGGAGPPRAAGRSSASGHTSTGDHSSFHDGDVAYVARIALPVDAGRRGLGPGAYRLTITATNPHGTGRPETMQLTILP
jgi:hypothetical protein